jgi:hypothetical protein
LFTLSLRRRGRRSNFVSLHRERGQQVWHQNALVTLTSLYQEAQSNLHVTEMCSHFPGSCHFVPYQILISISKALFLFCWFTERALCETSGPLFGFLTALVWVCVRHPFVSCKISEDGRHVHVERMNEWKTERKKKKRRKYSNLF